MQKCKEMASFLLFFLIYFSLYALHICKKKSNFWTFDKEVCENQRENVNSGMDKRRTNGGLAMDFW